MMILLQKTTVREVALQGVGVHSGLATSVTLKPAAVDAGISIINPEFPTDILKIGTVVPESAMYATVLKAKQWRISTVEHLMAALAALGIDNLVVEVHGDEMPIMDGSARPFIDALLGAGIVEQGKKRRFLTPRETLQFVDTEHDRLLEITPASLGDAQPGLFFDYQATFEGAASMDGNIACQVTTDFFVSEIAPARTFGFLNQLPFMQKHGLAKGASLENTLVIGEQGFINERRFEDEMVRHKFLDLYGDLALLGLPLVGTVKAKRTGHNFNRLVIAHYVEHPDQWRLLEPLG